MYIAGIILIAATALFLILIAGYIIKTAASIFTKKEAVPSPNSTPSPTEPTTISILTWFGIVLVVFSIGVLLTFVYMIVTSLG